MLTRFFAVWVSNGRMKLYRARAVQLGLGLLGLAVVVPYLSEFASIPLGSATFALFLFVAAPAGFLGFVFLVLSTFLPAEKRKRPTFTQELMGRERVQYGVYTEGNWMSVLDEKEKEDKARRRR